MSKEKLNVKLIKSVLNLIHSIQMERGLIAFYFHDKKNYEDYFSLIQKNTDKIINELSLEQETISLVQDITSSIKNIRNLKKNVFEDVASAADFYSSQVVKILTYYISQKLCLSDDLEVRKSSLFYHFLHWLDCLSLGFAYNHLWLKNPNKKDYRRLYSLKLEQSIHTKIMFDLASYNQKNIINSVRKSDIDNKVADYYRMASENRAIFLEIPMREWFDLFERKMILLYNVKQELFDTMYASDDLEKISKQLYDFISDLPFFEDLRKESLYSILQHAKEFAFLGDYVITSGDNSKDYIFIVLEGKVKLFRINESKDESIFQIAKPGDVVLVGNFMHLNYALEAKMLSSGKLLGIPIEVLRQVVNNEHDITKFVIRVLVKLLDDTRYQFGEITLKDAEERVGSLLLDLAISDGMVSREFELPCDKAVLAKFLNIRPETFSRILNNLKKSGITTKGHKVSIEEDRLCKYCQDKQKAKCKRYTNLKCYKFNCPNTSSDFYND